MSDVNELEVMAKETNDVSVTNDAKAKLVSLLKPVAEKIVRYNELAIKIEVKTKEDANAASSILNAIADDEKRVADALDLTVKKLHGLHKMWTSFRWKFLDPLSNSKKTIKGKVTAWQAEEERKARELAAMLQAEADKKARKEREALEKKAAQMKTPEKQQEYLERASMVSAPVITVQTEVKVEGLKARTDWRFEVVNPALVPREFLIIDDQKVGRVVKAMKEQTNIPGIRAYSVKV